MEMCTNCALRYGAFRLNDEWPDSDPGSDLGPNSDTVSNTQDFLNVFDLWRDPAFLF